MSDDGKDGEEKDWTFDMAREIMEGIYQMPIEQQRTAAVNVMSGAMKAMPTDALRDVRKTIEKMRAEFGDDVPQILFDVLEVLDGQLALREIGGGDDWR